MYRHALRPKHSDDEVLRRALRPSVGINDALDNTRRGGNRGFAFDATGATEIATALATAVPGWRERVLADANRIAEGRVRLLGADEILMRRDAPSGESSGGLIWHEDVFNEYSWDASTYYRHVPIPYGRAEAKVPWELSRFQHLPTMAMAYLLSADDRYAQEITAQIEDWLEQNPWGYGINWACTMEVAIRAVNWLWALQLIATAPAATDAFLTRVLAALVLHARHIRSNIEIYEGGVTTNHTLADYAGLVYLGAALRDFAEADGWLETGMLGVEECMRAQVLPDGADFENSIPYHRLVLEMFVGAYLAGARTGRPASEAYRGSLARMFEFTYHYIRPDGLAPLLGDSDDGRLQILSHYFDWEPRDHRYLLAVGAALFGRDDFARLASGAPGAAEEVAWLLGAGALADLQHDGSSPTPASQAFPDAGRYIMRDGPTQLIVSVDEVGTDGFGNHKHNDIFSFELTVDAIPVVVDSGSYLYVSDPRWRDHFRSTAAHSTLVVDGAEQNRLTGPFGMQHDARVRVNDWRPGADADVLDATHSGFERLPSPVAHRRRICFARAPFRLLVVDTLHGQGEHDVDSFLHLERSASVQTDITPDIDADSLHLLAGELGTAGPIGMKPGPALRCVIDGAEFDVIPFGWNRSSVEQGWFSPRWGKREPAPVLRFSATLSPETVAGYLIQKWV